MLEWDERYSVQVKRMDDQHKILFDIINELSDASDRGEEYLILDSILGSMEYYAKFHFMLEEKYMEDDEYPELDEQRRQHEGFIRAVAKFREELKEDAVALPAKIADFLQTWLTSHIMKSDKKYGPFLNERGIT